MSGSFPISYVIKCILNENIKRQSFRNIKRQSYHLTTLKETGLFEVTVLMMDIFQPKR